jgi:transcriptional regulator with XRE-family HTH domain/tetratricopeptide (TPR) repeat protein
MEERTKLIQARARKHWTQEQAAGFVGVDVGTYRKWEHGTVIPRPSSIQLLCSAFEMSSEELGFGDECVDISRTEYHPVVATLLRADLSICLQAEAFVPQRFQAVEVRIAAILEEYDMNGGDPLTRREALIRLTTLPFLASLRPGLTIRQAEDVVTQCSAGIAACWELSKSGKDEDLTHAFTIAAAYAETLKGIVHDSALQRKAAASLVGQCALLRAILGWHLETLDRATIHGKEALFYGETAEDIPLQITAHTQLSWIYHYGRNSKKALEEIEEAAHLLTISKFPLSPHLRSSVQTTLAIRQAVHGQTQQAISSLKQAHKDFFQQPEEGIAFAYVDYEQPSLILEDGMTYLNLGHYDTALDSFEQVIDPKTLKTKVSVAERVRVEILNNQALASLKTKAKDQEQSVHIWKAAMQGAKALKSEQRYSEALRAYDIMEALWSDDKRIKELRELTPHW